VAWGCITSEGVGELIRIEEIMNTKMYTLGKKKLAPLKKFTKAIGLSSREI
jgi:hypothetical protein